MSDAQTAYNQAVAGVEGQIAEAEANFAQIKADYDMQKATYDNIAGQLQENVTNAKSIESDANQKYLEAKEKYEKCSEDTPDKDTLKVEMDNAKKL